MTTAKHTEGQILWTQDAVRISRLFCRRDITENTITVHTPMAEYVIRPNPNTPNPVVQIGKALAGNPVGDTEQILINLNL